MSAAVATVAASAPVAASLQSVTWHRLRGGEWGIKGPAAMLRPGRTVDVVKRDDTISPRTVARIVWTDGTTTIATVEGKDAGRAPRNSYRRRPRFDSDHAIDYGYTINPRGRCIDAPCCGCCD